MRVLFLMIVCLLVAGISFAGDVKVVDITPPAAGGPAVTATNAPTAAPVTTPATTATVVANPGTGIPIVDSVVKGVKNTSAAVVETAKSTTNTAKVTVDSAVGVGKGAVNTVIMPFTSSCSTGSCPTSSNNYSQMNYNSDTFKSDDMGF
ncbi:MAG: hypothetical protein AABY32_04370 [Nanoarchaeota archaeon]